MRSLLLTVALALAFPVHAWAGWPDRVGTRALGMGGAMRGQATGDAGPMLNPSGMALARSYAVEGSYQLNHGESGHRPHVSVVDSTSAFNIAGGLYYTYVNARPGTSKLTGHEAGAALALPFGQRVFFGAQLKYLRLLTESLSDEAPARDQKVRGFTFDLGATLRPVDFLNIGVVGYNLTDESSPLAPLALGFGISATPLPGLLLVADSVIDFTTYDKERGNAISIMGGAEYSVPSGIAVRVGGGRSGYREAGYVSAGASALSELGALDFGVSRDLSGDAKLTVFAVSVRLFAATATDPG